MGHAHSSLPQKLLSTWVDIGRTWGKFGVNIGRTALETAADTLNATASTMNVDMVKTLKERKIEREQAAEAPEQVEQAAKVSSET